MGGSERRCSSPRWAGRGCRLALAALAGSCLLALLAGAGWAETSIEAQSAEIVHEGSHLLERWGYAAIFGIVTVDFLGVPVPATSVMVAAAVAAMHGKLWLPTVILLSFLGVIVGSQLGYVAGRFGGAYALHHLPISEERLAKVDRSYARWGIWIVVLAPYIDGLRQLNAFVAGMLELPWWRFAIANLAGSIIWVGGWVGGVYLIDEHLPGIVPALKAMAPLLLAMAAAALITLFIYLFRVPPEPGRKERRAPPSRLPLSRAPERRREGQDEKQDLEPAGQHAEHEQPLRGIGDPGERAARTDAGPQPRPDAAQGGGRGP